MTEHRKDASSLTRSARALAPRFTKQASIAALLLAASLGMAHAQQSAPQGDAAKPAADQGGSRQIVVEDKPAAPASGRIQVLPPAGASGSSPQAQDEQISPNAAAARAARDAEPAPSAPPPQEQATQQAAPPNPTAAASPPPAENQAAPPKARPQIVEEKDAPPPRKRVKKRRYHDYVEYDDPPPPRYYAPRPHYAPAYRPYDYEPPYYRY